MTCNFSGLTSSRQKFAVYLKRKACLNDNQNARRKVDYVQATDWQEAKAISLAKPENKAFIIDGRPKEVR